MAHDRRQLGNKPTTMSPVTRCIFGTMGMCHPNSTNPPPEPFTPSSLVTCGVSQIRTRAQLAAQLHFKETPAQVDPHQNFCSMFNREADEYDKRTSTTDVTMTLKPPEYSYVPYPGYSRTDSFPLGCRDFRVHRGYPKRTPTSPSRNDLPRSHHVAQH